MNSPLCPHCHNTMKVTRLHCIPCDIKVTGFFNSDRFSNFKEDELQFMEQFIMARGNLKELQESLELSYPTVRNRLDRLVERMQQLHENDQREQAAIQKKQETSRQEQEIIAKHSRNY